MEIKPKHSNKCDIIRAAEWIAFYLIPTTPAYEQLEIYENTRNSKKYAKKASQALASLRIALIEGCLIATGEKDGKRIKIPAKGVQTLDFLIEDPLMVMPSNSVILNTDSEFAEIYENVEFDTEKVIKIFPSPDPESDKYIPDIVAVMNEISREEHISPTHQPKKDYLRIRLEERLNQRGIPYSGRQIQAAPAFMVDYDPDDQRECPNNNPNYRKTSKEKNTKTKK